MTIRGRSVRAAAIASQGILARRAVLLLAALGLGADLQAFTLIALDHPVVIMSKGDTPPADAASEITNRPRNSISENGCLVVFTSRARNLAPSQIDNNGVTDVFLYNRCASPPTVTLVSHRQGRPDEAPLQGQSDQPVISPDGLFVVFRSTADDIVPGTGFGTQTNVFLWDLIGDSFTLVSHGTGGATEAGDDDSLNGVISRDPAPTGRFVAFESMARNLAAADNKSKSDVFRFDASNGQVVLVSVPNPDPGPRETDEGSFRPDIDGPGGCVVYESYASNLVSDTPSDDMNNALDVFLWESGGEPFPTVLISHVAGVPSQGTGAKTGLGESTEPSLDDACKRVAFKSSVGNLDPLQVENNGGTDVFVAGINPDAVVVSHKAGTPGETGDGESLSPILSRDGQWVAYASLATDLAPNQSDSGGTSDVFLFDVDGDKTLLVSHQAADDDIVGSGESNLPEISRDGRYVAYVSKAKDLDPNQNDGNGEPDVFLYTRKWNNSIVASRRYASIAITGNRRSFQPALSGDGLFVAFTSEANDLIADDPDPPGQTDVFLFLAPFNLPFLTARSTSNSNVIEWVTPAVNYLSMETYFLTGDCPATLTYGDVGPPDQLPTGSPRGNTRAQLSHGPLAADTTYCYAIFVQRDAQSAIQSGDAPWRTTTGRTFSDPTGTLRWTINLAGIAALTQVGIGRQNHVAVDNDGGVYAFTRGPTGGLWSGTSWPFRVFQPIQGRPPIIGDVALGAARTTFVGSQNGRAYAFDADRVALAGGALWYTTPKLSAIVQPGASGMFNLFGGLANHILIGARNGAAGTFYALDATSGAVRGSYSGGGPPFLGAITGAASVHYAPANRVYFTSRKLFVDEPSLWCLNLTATGFGSPCWTRSDPGNISGGPVQRAGRVYVGDDFGELWAFDSATGNPSWPGSFFACPSGGGVKGFVLADRGGTGQDLYFSTSSVVCAVTDLGASPTEKWRNTAISNPSTPILARILGVAYIFVGSDDGRLYQIEADNPTAVTSVLLRTAPAPTIGPPAFDVLDNMIYVGSEEGIVYAVQAPLP